MQKQPIHTSFISSFIGNKLFMTHEAFDAFMMETMYREKQSFYEIPTYKDFTDKSLINIVSQLSDDEDIKLTTDYSNPEIIENSIAYHMVRGTIFADYEYWWYFSSKRFRDNLIAADNNNNIMAHVVHVNSGGGIAWYLDVVAETMKNLKKPVIAVVEQVAASAAIYLIAYADRIYASTPNEILGSIGTMVSFWTVDGWYESMGLKKVEAYAHPSTLKNHKYNELKKGNAEQFITEELDPLAWQFIDAVRDARPITAKLDRAEHPLFQGETFDTANAITLGLIDGQMLLEDAIREAFTLGKEYISKQQKVKNVFQLLT